MRYLLFPFAKQSWIGLGMAPLPWASLYLDLVYWKFRVIRRFHA
jgi:hypothetical protein